MLFYWFLITRHELNSQKQIARSFNRPAPRDWPAALLCISTGKRAGEWGAVREVEASHKSCTERASEREREGREMTSWVSERSLIIESDEEEEQQQQRRRGGDDAGLGSDSDGSGSSSSSCTTPRRGPVTAASASASSYTHQWPQSYRYAPRVLPLFCLITPRFEFNFAATLTNG
jgi:hypothetical protein